MSKQHSLFCCHSPLKKGYGRVFLLLFLLGLSACSNVFQPNKQTIKTSSGEEIDLNDAVVKQYVEEWHEAKPSIDRLAKLENDLGFLLSEVSKMSDVGQVPGLASNQSSNGVITVNNLSGDAINAGQSSMPTMSSEQIVDGQAFAMVDNGVFVDPGRALCSEPFSNHYKKSLAFVSFPRVEPTSSSLGSLYQVEQHLPMLMGANLRNRHAMLPPTYLRESFAGAGDRGELAVSSHALSLARKNRVQFLVSGEVNDMSLSFPNSVINPSYYTRFINGVHNLLHINTKLDKRSRVFSFTLQVRDGVTGQTIFSNQYQTFGQWKAGTQADMGFGSPRFWLTDYGKQIQQLVAKASDELAGVIQCQPYLARVDSRPGQSQVILQSGANNGLRIGDAMELYQLIQHPITGEYQKFDTRLVKSDSKVYITEVYPAHSVGRVDNNEMLLNGQYLVKAP